MHEKGYMKVRTCGFWRCIASKYNDNGYWKMKIYLFICEQLLVPTSSVKGLLLRQWNEGRHRF